MSDVEKDGMDKNPHGMSVRSDLKTDGMAAGSDLMQGVENLFGVPRSAEVIRRAVCHDILEFSARVLDAELSSDAVTRSPFASSRERNARSSKYVLDHAHSTQI